MMSASQFSSLALVLVATYYATTLALWFGHRFSHLPKSPLRTFHLSGHHTLYPHSRSIRSERFLYGSGRASSIPALLPWLVLQAGASWLLLPARLYAPALVETICLAALFNYVHTQLHLLASPLEPFGWFREARRRHALHHDLDVNFMVADHLWDRVFWTYRDGDPLPSTNTIAATTKMPPHALTPRRSRVRALARRSADGTGTGHSRRSGADGEPSY